MAIDNETEEMIRKKLNKFLMDLHLEHEADTGPLIAATLIRTGTAMYFYCENDVAAAGVAVLEAAASGIEQARNFISLDQFDEAQNATLQ